MADIINRVHDAFGGQLAIGQHRFAAADDHVAATRVGLVETALSTYGPGGLPAHIR